MKSNKIKISIVIVCCFLVMAIILQARTMNEVNSVVTQNFANEELKDTMLQWMEKYNKAVKSVEESNKELKAIRETVSNNNNDSTEKANELKRNNMLLGSTNVIGDGIIIKLKDSQSTTSTDDMSSLIVHEGDLRSILSELTNAGAEAVSINGQRIVFPTSIVCAGNIISVNGERISSPFEIRAIGNQENLYSVTRPGSYLQLLKDDGISVDVRKVSNIEILKFNGVITNKYLKAAK